MLKTSAKKEDETQEAVLDSYYRALTDTTEDEADLIRELIEFFQSKGKSVEEAMILAVAEMNELNEETSQQDPFTRFDASPEDRERAKDLGAISIADMFAPINEDISS
jgi:CO dehydrogenase/acetyl-CoA synthase beta subunit